MPCSPPGRARTQSRVPRRARGGSRSTCASPMSTRPSRSRLPPIRGRAPCSWKPWKAPTDAERGRPRAPCRRAPGHGLDPALLPFELEIVDAVEFVVFVVEIEIVIEFVVLVPKIVFVLGQGVAAGLVGALEPLDELVALVLVDGRLVGDQHPLGAVELVALEQLVIDLRRVVDDDHDLRLGVEVGARPERQLVELEASRVAHGGFISNLRTGMFENKSQRASWIELLQGSLHLDLDVDRL